MTRSQAKRISEEALCSADGIGGGEVSPPRQTAQVIVMSVHDSGDFLPLWSMASLEKIELYETPDG